MKEKYSDGVSIWEMIAAAADAEILDYDRGVSEGSRTYRIPG